MKDKFRYDTTGHWYKGNVHIHTTASDGGKTAPELAVMYANAGYDFLFRTDHSVASDVSDEDEKSPLLWLDGIELAGDFEGSNYHVLCLGSFRDIPVDSTLDKQIESVRSQEGILILAHPGWSGNSVTDALRWDFDGIEIYNHVCRWLNGKSSGLFHWDMLLEKGDMLGFAVDDAHVRSEHPGWNGGWITVNAHDCSPVALTTAIKDGNFYSSCGPEFYSIEMQGGSVVARTSPVQFARLVGPGSNGARAGSFSGDRLSEISFEVPQDWPYVRLEIEDESGRRAWTNTL